MLPGGLQVAHRLKCRQPLRRDRNRRSGRINAAVCRGGSYPSRDEGIEIGQQSGFIIHTRTM